MDILLIMTTLSTKTKIGILLIATWKYQKFIANTISGIRKYFFKNSDVKIFLHTDKSYLADNLNDLFLLKYNNDPDKLFYIEHKPWPYITLFRFDTFLTFESEYDVDYLFYLDIDVLIRSDITEKILSNFCVVKHWGYTNNRGTPETNQQSTAYIAPFEPITYVAGGFFGGKKNFFMKAAQTINNNIQKDLQNDIIAIWHDESHLNRFVVDNYDLISILDHCYLSSIKNCSDSKIIPYNNKTKGFNKFKNIEQ